MRGLKKLVRARLLLSVALVWSQFSTARADGWTYWGQVSIPNLTYGTQSAKLATDGTNLFYSTLLDGVYRASLADHQFIPMPLTGIPIWDAVTNTNGYAVWNLAVAPHGTLLLSGSPVNVTSNNVSPPPNTFNNTLPVFYWWDETNQLWHAASIANKTYPYTFSAGNFCNAPDGSVWTCSGFATYAYRSTDDGHSYTAFDINARVPANYFPVPPSTSQTTFGKVFSIVAGPRNEVVIGTETGGYLHTTNNGVSWTSLSPDFTSLTSTNPLGRIGNAIVAGLDHYGNFLCGNFEFNGHFPGETNWYGVTLIGWHPADNACFNAAHGFPAGFGAPHVFTPPSGMSFTFMNQNYLLQGGIYRSPNGRNWTQFNEGSGLDLPFAPGITNAVAPGNCITTLGNLIFIATGNTIYFYDSTPPPVTNRPPVGLPQNVNLWENTPTNLTLTGSDADGDALSFTITTPPQRGALTGTPPDLTYTPSNNVTGPDSFSFAADDGITASASTFINLAINSPTNTLSTIALVSPVNGGNLIAPTNVTITAAVSDPDGVRSVNFYIGNGIVGVATNTPYVLTLTNLPPGDYTVSARAIDNLNARTWSAPVRISVLPVLPRLSIQQASPTDVAVGCPLELDGFYLESATDVAGPWMLSPVPPILNETNQTATIPVADQQFFRLMHPR
jgi:hypothetical protein